MSEYLRMRESRKDDFQEYEKHLLSGGKLFFTAQPVQEGQETLMWAVDMNYLYDAKMLPTGKTWISEPLQKLPDDASPSKILEATIAGIGMMSTQVGGAILTISIAKYDLTTDN